MKNHLKYFIIPALILWGNSLYAQISGPGLYFSVPDSPIVGQAFVVNNASVGIPPGTIYTWTFENSYGTGYLMDVVTDTIIQTNPATPFNYVYNADGIFTITLSAAGYPDYSKTIFVKGLINGSCSQYVANYNYINCDYVTNGSFNDYTALGVGTYNPSIHLACPWSYAAAPYSLGSADHFHQSNPDFGLAVPNNRTGYQSPSEGQGYAGILTYTSGGSREYFHAPLKQPLQSGSVYNVKFKVSLAEGSNRATKVSACFVSALNNTEYTQNFPGTAGNNIITINPNKCVSSNIVTDKTGWTTVTGTITGDNILPQSKIIIGQFNFTGQGTPSVTIVSPDANYPFLTQGNAGVPGIPAVAYYYIDEVSVTPVSYCHCNTTKTFGTNINSVTYTSQLGLNPGQSASIIGRLIVDAPSFTLNNVNIKFAPDSRLEIPAGTKLNLANGSVLEACTDMWDGVFCNGEILMFKGTIRDAKSALNFVSGSKWNIQQSVLENNRRHIYVDGGTSYPLFSSNLIKNNKLRCNPVQMKPPFAGQYTYNAIEIINVRTMQIGQAGPIADRNEISDAYRGIYAKNVITLNVENNHFERIKCYNPLGVACGKGTDFNVAILAEGTASLINFPKVLVGIYGNLSSKNTFDDCTGGVYTVGNMRSEVYHTAMTNIRDFGIHSLNNNQMNNGMYFLENDIRHAKTGIYVYNCGNMPVFAMGNTISKMSDYKSVLTYGIRVENPLLSSSGYTVFVNGNTVTRYCSGINIRQVNQPQAMNNTVYTHATLTDYPEGIRVDHCPRVLVSENSIHEQSAGGQSIGIRVEYSLNATTTCNNTYANHISMFFGGDNNPSTVGANYMYNGRKGIYVNWGQIGVQGPPKMAHMNAWYGNNWSQHLYAYGNNSGGSASHFWLKFPGSVFSPNGFISDGTLCLPISTGQATQTNNSDIPPFVWNCRDVLEDRSLEYLGMLPDSIDLPDSTVYKEEIEWSKGLALYRSVKGDTSDLLDAALYLYRQNFEGTTAGRLDIAKDSVLYGNTAAGNGKLSEVLPTREIETKLREVYVIAFDKFSQIDSTWEFSETELDYLNDLAAQCPYQYGEAVYTARNLLYAVYPDTLYINECEGVDWGLEKSGSFMQKEQEEPKVQVYPNPSSDNFVFLMPEGIEQGKIEIMDIRGTMRHYSQTFKGSNVIIVNGDVLSTGTYIYRVTDAKGNELGKGKLEKL